MAFDSTRTVIFGYCDKSLIVTVLTYNYRVTRVVANLGWVDFDLDVPPSRPVAQPILPNSHLPKHKWADSGMTKFIVDPTNQSHPVLVKKYCKMSKYCDKSLIRTL